jgi:hypothetical protein
MRECVIGRMYSGAGLDDAVVCCSRCLPVLAGFGLALAQFLVVIIFKNVYDFLISWNRMMIKSSHDLGVDVA